MRFLFDVCAASLRMQRALERRGHDVRSVVDINPRATDHEILSWATAEQRVLVTEDKDFGELVFVRRLPHACIVRFVEMGPFHYTSWGCEFPYKSGWASSYLRPAVQRTQAPSSPDREHDPHRGSGASVTSVTTQ